MVTKWCYGFDMVFVMVFVMVLLWFLIWFCSGFCVKTPWMNQHIKLRKYCFLGMCEGFCDFDTVLIRF